MAPRVLLTGGSGFIATHIMGQLLGNSVYSKEPVSVITTVRSQDKADAILAEYASDAQSGQLVVAIVPDIADPTAFDAIVRQYGGSLTHVFHTASPFHFKFTDPKTELVDPALNGTVGILKAIAKHAPGVKRVVITSSFAAILDEAKLADPSTIFSEQSWNPVTVEDIHRSPATAYRASKTLAEQAAWDFVKDEKNNAKFDLVTINPPMVFGPALHYLGKAALGAINTSNERIVDLLAGKWKEVIPPIGAAFIWVDVRDVAEAHVRAGLDCPEAGGRRLFTTAGTFSNAEICEIVRRKFPEYKDKLPEEGKDVGGRLPDEDKRFKYDNSETTRLLRVKWKGLEECVVDTVESLKKYGA